MIGIKYKNYAYYGVSALASPDGLKHEYIFIVVFKSIQQQQQQQWRCSRWSFFPELILYHRLCNIKYKRKTEWIPQKVFDERERESFVIVVWGRNFKYSLSINSKQKPYQLKIYALTIVSHCIPFSKYSPFRFQAEYRVTVNMIWNNKHSNIFIIICVWQLWFKFCALPSMQCT